MIRYILTFLAGSVFLGTHLFAQCIGIQADTLALETFEAGLPSLWQAPEGSEGGAWNIDAGTIGYYMNAGEGSWLYINDENGNLAGEAFFETEAYDFSQYTGFLQMEFDMTFQDYADSGFMKIEVYQEGEWNLIMEESNDFFGHIAIDIQQFASEEIKFRFTFNDEGAWGWGMGIDNFLITGRGNLCGNNVCDYGESPESCPGDCAQPTKEASSWIAIDTDLDGQEVQYTRFNGTTSCDDCTEEVALGFSFSLYETSYSSAFINTNGNLTFGEPFLAFTPTPYCLKGPKMVAPFFADIDLAGGGEIYYYADPEGHYFIATWHEVAYFGCGQDCEQTNTFQVILTDGSVRSVGKQIIPRGTTVIFQYQDMQWTTGNSSEGSRGFGGKPATVGLNKGDGETCQDYGTFDQPGYGYYANVPDMECLNNAVDHLDYRSITFDGLIGESVAPSGELHLSLAEDQEKNIVRLETDIVEGIEFFVVERSGDGINFDELTSIDVADGLNGVPGFYEYVDEQPLTGKNHYRVVEIKSDGQIEYSEIRHLERVPATSGLGGETFELTQVGPNPFKDHVNFSFTCPKTADVTYILVDMNGRIQQQGILQAQQGVNAMRLELSNLPTAMYVLTIYQGEEKDYRQLVKQ